jgi:hypothetical protein
MPLRRTSGVEMTDPFHKDRYSGMHGFVDKTLDQVAAIVGGITLAAQTLVGQANVFTVGDRTYLSAPRCPGASASG